MIPETPLHDGCWEEVKQTMRLMVGSGLTPQEIRAAVVDGLAPYLEVPEGLSGNRVLFLIPEFVHLTRLQENPWNERHLRNCLNTYRCAKAADSQRCFREFAAWQPQQVAAMSTFWSVLHLEHPKNTIHPDDFVHECFRNVGDIVEGLTKPYLTILHNEMCVALHRDDWLEAEGESDLGTTVDRLATNLDYADFFEPPPWRLRLNQWRNVAFHYSVRTQGGDIHCTVGKGRRAKILRLERGELLRVVHTLYDVFAVLKLAAALFHIDNVHDIESLVDTSMLPEERAESALLPLTTALMSHGFEVVSYELSQRKARLVIRDMTDADSSTRRGKPG